MGTMSCVDDTEKLFDNPYAVRVCIDLVAFLFPILYLPLSSLEASSLSFSFKFLTSFMFKWHVCLAVSTHDTLACLYISTIQTQALHPCFPLIVTRNFKFSVPLSKALELSIEVPSGQLFIYLFVDIKCYNPISLAVESYSITRKETP